MVFRRFTQKRRIIKTIEGVKEELLKSDSCVIIPGENGWPLLYREDLDVIDNVEEYSLDDIYYIPIHLKQDELLQIIVWALSPQALWTAYVECINMMMSVNTVEIQKELVAKASELKRSIEEDMEIKLHGTVKLLSKNGERK